MAHRIHGTERGHRAAAASAAAPIAAQFRNALPDEVGALEALQRRTAMVSNYREQILAHPDAIEIPLKAVADGNARVAVAGGRILGFSIVLPLADGLAELDGLFVEPEFMRRGLGRALLEDAFAMARNHGVRRIEVTSNREAVGFYERIGFVADGPAPTRFGPAVRMHIDVC
jgi:ribosomal protein S18 acetylase RimI-like enzyme